MKTAMWAMVGVLLCVLTGCKGTATNPVETTLKSEMYKAYVDRKPMGEVLVIESDATHPASFNATGSKITISTLVPPVQPPPTDDAKYHMVSEMFGKACNVATFGLGGYFLRDIVKDSGSTTNVYNEAAPVTP